MFKKKPILFYLIIIIVFAILFYIICDYEIFRFQSKGWVSICADVLEAEETLNSLEEELFHSNTYYSKANSRSVIELFAYFNETISDNLLSDNINNLPFVFYINSEIYNSKEAMRNKITSITKKVLFSDKVNEEYMYKYDKLLRIMYYMSNNILFKDECVSRIMIAYKMKNEYKRSSGRKPHEHTVGIQYKNTEFKTSTVNLSGHRILIISPFNIQPGEKLQLKIHIAGRQ